MDIYSEGRLIGQILETKFYYHIYTLSTNGLYKSVFCNKKMEEIVMHLNLRFEDNWSFRKEKWIPEIIKYARIYA